MSMKRVIPTLLALVAFPITLSAQDAEKQIQAALERAAASGIPTSLLEDRVAEGRAKGIATDRIAYAVERRLAALARAQRSFSDVPDVTPDDLDVGADALETGVSEAVLTEVAGTAPRERRAAAIAALGYLVGADVAPQRALDRVREALDRGPGALQNLPVPIQGPGSVSLPVEIPAASGAFGRGAPGGAGIPAPGLPAGPPGG